MRPCVNCGAPLEPGCRSHRRTCSDACRAALHRQRQKAYVAALETVIGKRFA